MSASETKLTAQFSTARQFWDILPGESEKAFAAFQVYLKTDVRMRSTTTIASLTGTRPGIIHRWHADWLWSHRARALAEYEGDTARYDEQWGENKLAAHKVNGLRIVNRIDAAMDEVLKHGIYEDTIEVSTDGKTTIIRKSLGTGVLKELIAYLKATHDFMTKEVVQKPGAGAMTVNVETLQILVQNKDPKMLEALKKNGVTPEEFLAVLPGGNRAALYSDKSGGEN